jgi:hypothetical protein
MKTTLKLKINMSWERTNYLPIQTISRPPQSRETIPLNNIVADMNIIFCGKAITQNMNKYKDNLKKNLLSSFQISLDTVP